MNSDANSRLNAACRAVADQLLPATAQPQTSDGAKRHGLARFGTAQSENGKTKPNLPRWQLAPRKLTAIELLIDGCSVAKAARLLGIGRRTLFRWLNETTFRAELDRRIAAMRFERRDLARNGTLRHAQTLK